MRAALPALLAVLLAASWGGHHAHAAGPRLILDRVEAQSSWLAGRARLRLYVTAVKLEGSIIPVMGDDAWTVRLSGAQAREPMLVGRFAGTEQELAVVLVIERGFEYAEDLPHIRRAAKTFIEKLPDQSRVAVIDYGEDVHGGQRLQAPGAASRRIQDLLPDPAPADPELVEAMERAIRTLRRAEPEIQGAPLRRLIVVLSDGKDIDPAPDRYRDLGKRARRRDIKIHSLAYSPVDNRRPLLGLGEMSKRSSGTFRWVRNREGFSTQFRTLLDEIEQQYVLTFLLPKEDVVGKRVSLSYKQLSSNDVRVRDLSCGEEACEGDKMCVRHQCVARPRAEQTGILGWILWIIGAVVGVLLLLLLVGFILSRVQARREARGQAALAAVAGGAGQAGAGQGPAAQPGAGGHRIVGVDPHAGRGAPQAIPPGGAAGAGARAPSVAGPSAPPAAPGPAAQPALYIVKGPGQGTRIPVSHGLLIGTAANCQVRLEGDSFASSHHAQVVMDTAGGCSILDRGSTNGTFVNGVRTPQMRLQHGMLIKVGATELRFLER